MERYKNTNGKSNIEAYGIGPAYIDVKFFDTQKIYRYSYNSAGKENVEIMKTLALQGNGLNSFIVKNVRSKYER